MFLLLRTGEIWLPTVGASSHKKHDRRGVSGSQHQEPTTSAGHSTVPSASADLMYSSPIPRVVCEALNLLEIHREPPFWKIIDNRGRITLVLHWEQPRNNQIRYVEPSLHPFADANVADDSKGCGATSTRSMGSLKIKSMPVHPSEDIITVVTDDGTHLSTLRSSEIETFVGSNPQRHQLQESTLQGSLASKERNACIHPNTSSSVPRPLTSTSLHLPTSPGVAALSGRSGGSQQPHHHHHKSDECEFHCLSLHEEGRPIKGADSCAVKNSDKAGHASGKSTSHVRFHATVSKSRAPEQFADATHQTQKRSSATSDGHAGPGRRGIIAPSSEQHSAGAGRRDSSESEMEPESNNTFEDECENDNGLTTDKVLLLTDQLSSDQRKHLTILDLGVILERLKAKIIDVERLEREREGPSCFRWIIKATIRGDVLRDLGVLYNGNYYSISEDQGLSFAATGFEDEEDREDPV